AWALHGTREEVVRYRHGKKCADAVPDARLVTFEGGGHNLPGREAAKVNRLIRDFVGGAPIESAAIPPTTERRVLAPSVRRRGRKILWLSSPIGLGHIQRDIAIARTLRELHPD